MARCVDNNTLIDDLHNDCLGSRRGKKSDPSGSAVCTGCCRPVGCHQITVMIASTTYAGLTHITGTVAQK